MATTNTRTFIVLDGEETLLTNAVALGIALDALREVDADPAVIAKVEQHLATITRKSDTPKQPTKAQLENARYAQTLLGLLPADEAVTLDWVAGKLHLVGTDGRGNKQKALQVVKVLLAANKVVKIDGRPVQYQLV